MAEVLKVIDVSYAQGAIDWNRVEKVVKDGKLDGVIIRCGYGSDITSQDDNWYAVNVAEAEKRGIPYGLYLYSYANTQAKIQSEIQHTIRLAKNRHPVIGVYLDLEENSNGFIAASAAEQFVKALNALNYNAGVYCGAYFYRAYMMGVHERINSLWWIAGYGHNSGVPEYNFKPDPGFDYDGWQYTSVYRVDGINGGVDTSEWYTPWEKKGQPASQPINDTGFHYRGHSQTYSWLKSVRDGQIAGTVGESKRLEAIKITPPEGVELNVTVHVQHYGDIRYEGIKKGKSSGTESSKNDPIMGTVGEKLRLEGIIIECTKNETGKELYYQAHVQDEGWQDPVTEGMLAGSRGKSKRIEAIRIWMQ